MSNPKGEVLTDLFNQISPVSPKQVSFLLISHGLKRESLSDGRKVIPPADIYLDCRGLIDGHSLRADLKGQPYLDQMRIVGGSQLDGFMGQILDTIQFIPSRRASSKDPFSTPVVICFMCAHGINRSRTAKRIIFERLSALSPKDISMPQEGILHS